MLSALLPGVREFRTPFVTGLLWAVSVALVFGPDVVGSGASADFAARLEPLGVPSSAYLAGAGLVVYLLGSLLVFRRSPLGWADRLARRRLASRIERLTDSRRPARWRYLPIWWIWQKRLYRSGVVRSISNWANPGFDTVGGDAVSERIRTDFFTHYEKGKVPVARGFEECGGYTGGFEGFYDRPGIERIDGVGTDDYNGADFVGGLCDHFVACVRSEQSAVETRIQLDYPELYAEIDRLKVEAELRFSIFFPLVLLMAVLGFLWSPFVLLGIVAPVLMLREGKRRMEEADEKVWQVFLAGKVSTPLYDEIVSAEQGGATVKDSEERFGPAPDPGGVIDGTGFFSDTQTG